MSVLTEKMDASLKYVSLFNDLKSQLTAESPAVIDSVRKKAISDFIVQGIPSRKHENYKYTNLQPLFLPDYQLNMSKEEVTADLNAIFRCDVPQLDTHLSLLFNGWYYENNRETGILPDGVIMCGLDEAARKYPELIGKYYGTLAETGEDALVALNSALARDGYFIYVPKKVAFQKPVQLINLLQHTKEMFVTQRNLVVLEQGATLNLIICSHTLNTNRYLTNSVTEVIAGENAVLELYDLQNEHNNSASLNSLFIKQERDSKVTTHTSSLHGGLIRNNLKVILDGENAEANMFGMSFTDRKQHVDNFTRVVHAKPHCQSNQLYKNVLDNASTGAFSGRIHVLRDAQKTNAFQRNNNLLLTDNATMQTKPQLIIDADDVKCSHGATVGQIDEEALFYLRARGIEESKARLMMMNAFAHEVIQEIKIDALRERIDDLVEKRLKGEVARCHECAYNCDC